MQPGPLSYRQIIAAFISQTLRSIKKSKVNYALGFSACLLVVFVVALLVSILSKSPLIFLRLSELRSGEIDLHINAGSWTGYDRLNYTLISEILDVNEDHKYHTCRYRLNTLYYLDKECNSKNDPYDQTWKYGEFPQPCADTLSGCFSQRCTAPVHGANLFLINSDREKEMNLGREWKLGALAEGEVYLYENMARMVQANKGDIIYLQFQIGESFLGRNWLAGVLNKYNMSSDTKVRQVIYTQTVYLPMVVKDIFVDINGKYDTDTSNGMIAEYGTFMNYILKNMNPRMPRQVGDEIASIDLFEFAQSVQINLPPPRIAAYMNANYDVIQQNVIHFAGAVFYRLGFNSLGTDLPILGQLRQTRFFSLFLGLILNLIIGILLFLSVLLIYSLLMINVETRTFELGVLRMIGTTRPGIIILLLVQAFAYALPSWIIGLVLAQLVSIGVTARIYTLTGVPIEAALTWTGILSASAMGILIPVLAAILPIRNALGMNLQDSLDTKHNKTKAVQIDVERAEQGGSVSWTVVVIGIGLAAFGGIIYYVLPLSLLSFNLGLLLNMFMFILGGMLLGLTLLALNLQHMLEHLVVYLFLWWDKRAIRSLVLKNLTAHRGRNQKTTVMYAISLGFIIFISVAYTVQVGTFSYQQQQRSGCLLQVNGGEYDASSRTLRSLRTVKEFEDLLRAENATVKSHSWVTYELREAIYESRDTRVMNLGQLYSANQRIYGVSPNIFQAAIQGFLRVESSVYANNNDYVENDLTSLLYTSDGSKQALVGSLYKVKVGLELDKPFLLSLRYNDNGTRPGLEVNRVMAPMAFLDAAPAFAYSQFPTISTQDYVVSLPTFARLSSGVFNSVDELPLKHLLLELHEGLTDRQIDQFKSKLTDIVRYGNTGAVVWDYRDSMRPFNTATVAMQYFFNFTTVIAMAISFFSLMSSMFTNVFEQTKEIGVLRAIGIGKSWMYRIYIYEAFVLVLSSSLLGVLIGTIVAFTMTLQQSLFTQLPVPFDFPYTILFVVFGCSIFFSILAAFSPIRSVLNQKIVQIFRILN